VRRRLSSTKGWPRFCSPWLSGNAHGRGYALLEVGQHPTSGRWCFPCDDDRLTRHLSLFAIEQIASDRRAGVTPSCGRCRGGYVRRHWRHGRRTQPSEPPT
jgi:hypothetical protein